MTGSARAASLASALRPHPPSPPHPHFLPLTILLIVFILSSFFNCCALTFSLS